VKRLAPTLVVLVLFLTLGSAKAWSQRNGSMQVTAQVVDTRAAASGLESAQNLAASWTLDPTRTAGIATRYAQVSLVSPVLSVEARPESRLEIRVEFLRN